MKESCLVIAGERSGEDHFLSFFDELLLKSPNCHFFGVGGSRMQRKGFECLYKMEEFSSIGITDVLGKIPFYYRALWKIKKEVVKRNCKTAILIDFQGFNLKLAKTLKKEGVKVLYYVAPQAWVWKAYRAKVLEKNVHTLFTIIPFEKKWFTDRGVSRVKAVVHPLLRTYKDDLQRIPTRKFSSLSKKKKILLLPGSRKSEISMMLPIFDRALALVQEQIADIEIGIVQLEGIEYSNYTEMKYHHTFNSVDLADALCWADVCLATSGTVTLACGLFQVPTVVAYKVDLFSEFILKSLISYDGAVSLTNIVHERYVFPEYLNYHADRYNLSKALLNFLTNSQKYDETINILSSTPDKLIGDDFDTADYITSVINESSK